MQIFKLLNIVYRSSRHFQDASKSHLLKKIIQIQLHPRETNLLFDIWLIGVFCYADGAMKNFRTRLNRQRTHLTLSVRPAGYLWTSWESPNF